MNECPPKSGPVFVTIRPPGGEPYGMTLDRLTAHVRAARKLKTMGRLADTLKKASDAKAGLETAVEADVTGYIDRVAQVHKRRQTVFMAKHGELDLDVTDLAEFEADLEDFAKNDRSSDGATSENKTGDAYVGTNPPKR
jgi:hypothetical protein